MQYVPMPTYKYMLQLYINFKVRFVKPVTYFSRFMYTQYTYLDNCFKSYRLTLTLVTVMLNKSEMLHGKKA